MSKKLTFDYVKKYIESFGYKLISTEYINAKENMIIICNKGHQYSASFNNFKNGKRCPDCAKESYGNQRRLDYNFVKNQIEQNGNLKLLSSEYKNNSTPLNLICDKEHKFKITYCGLQKNNMTCPICNKIKLIERLSFSYEEVKEYVESQGYILISKEYKNAGRYIELKCPLGHIFKTKYNNFRSGKRCRICSMKELGNKRRFSLLQVKEFIESFEGYKLLSSEYLGANKKLEIMCPRGHVFYKNYNKFRDGERCSVCAESKGEYKSRQYLESLNINFESQYTFSDCKNIEPLRFDFAVFYNIEKTKLAFLYEYDGEFHYFPIEGNRKLKYQQRLDHIKDDYCKQNNIPLIRIPYTDYDNIEAILKQQLINNNIKIKG